jgi:probable HAF family extracellular repeat protein
MRNIYPMIALIALAGCGTETAGTDAATTEPAAAASIEAHRGRPRYVVTLNEETLGGSSTVGTSINERGTVAGFSNLGGNQFRHAVIWRRGQIDDLGTLGGPNSNVQWPGLNEHGMVVGISQTADDQPLGEEWSCIGFFGTPSAVGKVCLGFFHDGVEMHPLPTLGGDNGFATGINNRAQVVGWAETPVHDPTCDAPQVLQFRAVLWEPLRGRKRELRPYPGDSTSAATAINDAGQVVGISGECDVAVGRFSAQRAVLWEHGRVKDIGNLGGIAWHTPMAINQRGDVVGFSNPAEVTTDEFLPHAFSWNRRDGIRDLELLDGDDFSQAFGINDRPLVVGRSCGASGCKAVIWKHGRIYNLNDLVGDYPSTLTAARDVNNEGVITGNLVDAASGRVLMFTARPR